ncbi:MAG: DUF2807 domain-containing protein [Bacteroidales bacterium]|nr:DUF2807 domain-containing protein [Bacteroidales bacterium]
MKNFFLFIISTFLLQSCMFNAVRPEGPVTTDSREISSFDRITVCCGLNLHLTYGEDYSLEIEANENFMEYIITEVKDNQLKIRVKKDHNLQGGTKNIHVSTSTLNQLRVSSGSTAKSVNTIKSDNLEVNVSSGAHANVKVEANELEADASSGAHLTISGYVNEQFDAHASSGAHIKAGGVSGVGFEGDVSSGAHIKVGEFKYVDGTASSGGHIKYAGNPEKVDVNKSSGGSVSN